MGDGSCYKEGEYDREIMTSKLEDIIDYFGNEPNGYLTLKSGQCPSTTVVTSIEGLYTRRSSGITGEYRGLWNIHILQIVGNARNYDVGKILVRSWRALGSQVCWMPLRPI